MILTSSTAFRIERTAAGNVCSLELPAASGAARWAWLADTHIHGDAETMRGGDCPSRNLRAAVSEVLRARPHGAIVNGDIAWIRGLREDYKRFGEFVRPLRTELPLALGVGNHDHRGRLMKALSGSSGNDPPTRLMTVIDQPPLRFIVLDSLIDAAAVGGELGEAQFEWLATTLADRPEATTLLFVHHPGESSSEGCRDFDALVEAAAAAGQVKAIVTAHDHEFVLGRADDLRLIGLPAVGFAFEAGVSTGWVEAELTTAGARLRFHRANGAAGERTIDWRV